MGLDWRNGFGAATGSVIVAVRQFGADSIQARLWLPRTGRWDVILGASSVLAFTLYYRPGHREPPIWLQECIRYFELPIRVSLQRLARIYSILIPGNVRFNVRIFGGFCATYFLTLFQWINIFKWQREGIQSAGILFHAGYILTVFLERGIFSPSRRCELGPREYLVRNFLSRMNILGLIFSFRPVRWGRTYLLFAISSLTALPMRYFDMMGRPDAIDDAQDNGIPLPVVRRVIENVRQRVRIPKSVRLRPLRTSVETVPKYIDSENNEISKDEDNEGN